MVVWVVDTDGGVDDAEAIVLALSNDEQFKVVAITTVAGNVGLDQATKNIAECLRVCDRTDIPLIKGATQPLIHPLRLVSSEIHGNDGLGDYWSRTYPSGSEPIGLPQAREGTAALEIIRLANEYKGDLGIVTIGPLTNLALALCLDETLAGKLARVVVMGGAPTGSGNITVSAEFNIWCDPEAAHIVFERIPRLELVSWELCIDPRHAFPKEWKQLYTSQNTQRGRFIGSIAGDHVEMCDPIALSIAMQPSVVLTFAEKEGWVELSGSRTRGMTVVNWEGSDLISVRASTRHNLKIIKTIDMDQVKRMFLGSLRD